MVEVFCRYITVKGKLRDAHDYGKQAWHFSVTEEEHEAYLLKKAKAKKPR